VEELKYWLWISKIRKIGSIRIQKLLKEYKTPKRIYSLEEKDLEKIEGIGEKLTKEILNREYRERLEEQEEYLKRNNIELISIEDSRYPKKLKQIYDMPICLYVKGNTEILNEFSIAVIGCRESTKYGEQATIKLVPELVKNNTVIISGLAKGIDSMAHKITVKEKGKTIAVIGSGLDNLYPKENLNLVKQILENGGAIITEYPIGTKPEKLNFPARNRIISGLSDGILVIEAKKKSGTMITVDFALEQGRQVFSVPGNITSKNSEGTNELIKQGAKLVTKAEDILEEFIMWEDSCNQ